MFHIKKIFIIKVILEFIETAKKVLLYWSQIESIVLDLVENANGSVHPNVLYVSDNERKSKGVCTSDKKPVH